MANDANKVSVGKPKVTGAIFRAPAGTALPTNATTALADTYKGLGYVSEDGVTNANSPESGNIKAWGGDTVYTYQSDKTDTFAFTLIETLNEDVLKAVYGEANVSGTLAAGLTVKANSAAQESAVWVIDMILRDNYARRIVIPAGTITELGEITYADESSIGYPVTITAVADASGNTHYEYTAKPAED